MSELEDAARALKRARADVVGWIDVQSRALRLVTNDQAPGWQRYVEAQQRLDAAIEALPDAPT